MIRTTVGDTDLPSLLAFKPHFRAHVLSDVEVALVSEDDRFALRGRPFALVTPLLDGTRTADTIAAELADELAPELTHFALNRLEARGYTMALPPADLAPWSAWWLARGDDHAGRVAATAECRVRVTQLGLDPALAVALADRIGRSVQVVDVDASLEVWLVDDYLRPELAGRISAALEARRTLLLVRPLGALIWLGPLCRPDEPPDWASIVARLRGNRPTDQALLAHGRSFPLMPAVSPPEMAELGLALAAVAIVRCAAGEAPAAMHRSIWTFDTRTLESRSHACPPPAAAPAGSTGQVDGAKPLLLVANPKRYRADGGHRVRSPEETLAVLERLVSPITGVVRGVAKLPSAPGVHVYSAIPAMGDAATAARPNRVLGRPEGAAGKGQTDIQARVSCLAEAVERHSCSFIGDEPRRAARFHDLSPAAIHPDDLLLFSRRQYQAREAGNRSHGDGYSWVPEPFAAEARVEWTPVWSLTESCTRWVPTAICYFGYDPAPAANFARADSNGCASGNTTEEAVIQALFELIERDACALWWYNRVRRPAIDLASFRQPFFAAMERHHRECGRALRVLDLRTDLGVPVALAVTWREGDGGGIRFGLGCHLEPRLAISRALSELNQMEAVESAATGAVPAHGTSRTEAWLESASVSEQPYLLPSEGQAMMAGDFDDRSSDDVALDVRHCVDRLCELGHETLVLDHTRADVGFPTARVIVPGLRHFWARFAPGRLYDVPVALGWLERANREEDLNPVHWCW